jgi:hypothetical protein
MGRAEPTRVAAAQVIGTADAFAQLRRLSEAEALAEIADIAGGRQEVLDLAAARYCVPDPGPEGWWYAEAARLLRLAGADLERAAAIQAGQGRSFSVGEDG